jgi:hypothetical protein
MSNEENKEVEKIRSRHTDKPKKAKSFFEWIFGER